MFGSLNVSFLCLTILVVLSFASSKPNGFSLELIRKDSLYPGNLTDTEKVNRLVKFSQIRANYLASVFNPSNSRFHVAQDYSLYLVKIQLGVPSIPLYLALDTGSALTWTQCEPCIHRYRQNPPIYNSSASHTYRKIQCADPFCRNNSPFFKCVNNECVYEQYYMEGAVTRGVVSKEIFDSSRNDGVSINFGCSRDSQNFNFFEHTRKSGGVMGLNRSPISLLQQLSNITRQRFSYCLLPYDAGLTGSYSVLRFGNDIPTRGRRFHSIPFVHAPNRSNYYLNLLDVSVAGHRLRFPANTFRLRSDGTGGCVIDSGTTVTHFIQPAYQRVLNAFQNYFDQRGFRRAHLPGFFLQLCYYNSQSASRDLPSMTFHFDGAYFVVESRFLIMLVNDGAAFCVALQPAQHITIIGAMNQGNTRFIYDVAAGRLQFASENCLRDR